MITQLKTWGNSKAVRIPQKAIRESGFTENDELSITVEKGSIVLSKADGEFSLERRMRAYAEQLGEMTGYQIDPAIRRQAETVCQEIGIPLAIAINIFLVKLATTRRIPFDVSADEALEQRALAGEKADASALYSDGFFDLFGSGGDLGFDEEPKEIPFSAGRKVEAL